MVGRTWPESEVQSLRDMIAVGMTFNEIAANIGKSRNSIAGMAWRLKIEKKKKPKIVKVKKVKPVKVIKPVIPKPEPVVIKEPVSPRYTITELTPNQCRWPIAQTDDGLHTFCANEKAEGKSYCPFHVKIAYVRPRMWGE